MKLSTRLKRYVYPDALTGREIVLMVGGGGKPMEVHRFDDVESADAMHNELIGSGCKLLPQECPVINKKEIVMHYTRTTYQDWCNNLVQNG